MREKCIQKILEFKFFLNQYQQLKHHELPHDEINYCQRIMRSSQRHFHHELFSFSDVFNLAKSFLP